MGSPMEFQGGNCMKLSAKSYNNALKADWNHRANGLKCKSLCFYSIGNGVVIKRFLKRGNIKLYLRV